jgi:NitT/TauT family transport system permease protein
MTSRQADLGLEARPVTIAPEAGRPERRRKRGKRSTFWRVRDEIPRRLELALLGVSLALPLLLWSAVYLSGGVSTIALPNPLDTAETGYRMAADGPLLEDVRVSTTRVVIGFGISLLIAVPLGLAMGTFASIRALFEPAIAFIRYAPATAFTMLFIIWLGLGEEPKIALVAFGTVFFNTLMIANVVWSVPAELLKVAQTLGAGGLTVFRKVIFPHAMPGMIDAARVNLAAAWNLIIVAELIAAEAGVGRRIVNSQKFLRTEEIFVVIVAIGIIGVTTDIGLRMLRNRLSPWSQE